MLSNCSEWFSHNFLNRRRSEKYVYMNLLLLSTIQLQPYLVQSSQSCIISHESVSRPCEDGRTTNENTMAEKEDIYGRNMHSPSHVTFLLCSISTSWVTYRNLWFIWSGNLTNNAAGGRESCVTQWCFGDCLLNSRTILYTPGDPFSHYATDVGEH